MTSKLPFYLALVLLTQCSKCKDDPQPSSPLPAATQEGKNTFGCLVNGQAYVTSGNSGFGRPAFVALYEPDPIAGGILNIDAVRNRQTIQLYAGPIFPGQMTYNLNLGVVEGAASYYDKDNSFPCNEYFHNDVSYRKGTLTITRLDERAGVIAGTFEFTIAKPGCDTVRVTQGRFDAKL